MKKFLQRLVPQLVFIVAVLTPSVIASNTNPYSGTVGSPSNPGGLASAINAVYGQSNSHGLYTGLTITPGTYVFTDTIRNGAAAYLSLANMMNFEIDAPGVTIEVNSQSAVADAIDFTNCNTVIFSGATIRYAAPLTGQGKIVNIGFDPTYGNYYDVLPDAGYSLNVAMNTAYYIFAGSTNKWKPGCIDLSFTRSSVLNSQTGETRLYWGAAGAVGSNWNPAVNDYVGCRGPGSNGALLHDDGCHYCTFENLNMYYGNIFGMFETSDSHPGQGNRYLYDTIGYGLVPTGGTNVPIMSQSADGFDSWDTRIGPDVENCSFTGMGDDGISIHGHYMQIAAAASNSQTIIVGTFDSASTLPFLNGDTVRILDELGSGSVQNAVVTAVTSISNPNPSMTTKWSDMLGSLNYYQLTLSSPVTVGFDFLAYDASASGISYKLLNNSISNHRGRGMVLKADNGLVEGNTINGSTMAGISLAPSTTIVNNVEPWQTDIAGEAGYPNTVLISGNTIENTGYSTASYWLPDNGGIAIHGVTCIGNQAITIQNNTFTNILAQNISVCGAANATIQGNVFQNTHQSYSNYSEGLGYNPFSVVWVGNSQNVTISQNSVANWGPYALNLVSVSSAATNVTGAFTGLTLTGKNYNLIDRSSGLLLDDYLNGGLGTLLTQQTAQTGTINGSQTWMFEPSTTTAGAVTLSHPDNGASAGLSGTNLDTASTGQALLVTPDTGIFSHLLNANNTAQTVTSPYNTQGSTITMAALASPFQTDQDWASQFVDNEAAWYRMVGNANDSSGNGRNGTLEDGASWCYGVNPSPDEGAWLNGGYIAINSSVINTTGSFSVAAWITPASTATSTMTFVSQAGLHASAFALQMKNDRFCFSTTSADSSSPTIFSAGSTIVPATYTWYHIVGVYNAILNVLELYVNGVAQSFTPTAGALWNASGDTVIGCELPGGTPINFMSGIADEVHLYNRALNEQEVQSLYSDTEF